MTLRTRFPNRNSFLLFCLVMPGIPFTLGMFIGFGRLGGPVWWLFLVIVGLLSAVVWGVLMWSYFEKRAARIDAPRTESRS
jgi:hypothetical protein